MAAYIVAQLKVHDPAAFQRYREAVTPLVDRFGGRYRVRGGELEVLEGDWPLPRLAIIEFQSRDAARLFYEFARIPEDPAAAAGGPPTARWRSSRACEAGGAEGDQRTSLFSSDTGRTITPPAPPRRVGA